jgi:UDP-glucuronate decarboxylase
MATPDEVTGPMNIGNPHEIQVRELADQVIRLAGSRSRLVFRPLPQDDPTQRCPDIAFARRVLGWEPSVDLDEGLSRTIGYFKRLLADRVQSMSASEVTDAREAASAR